jgi:7-cyano-7-deazaguanine synthase in queuosine biosynthesis
VGDQEHLDIIESYFEGLSMGKIAKKLDRSGATIHAQIHCHNESIRRMGYCAECRRLKGNHGMTKTSG